MDALTALSPGVSSVSYQHKGGWCCEIQGGEPLESPGDWMLLLPHSLWPGGHIVVKAAGSATITGIIVVVGLKPEVGHRLWVGAN